MPTPASILTILSMMDDIVEDIENVKESGCGASLCIERWKSVAQEYAQRLEIYQGKKEG